MDNIRLSRGELEEFLQTRPNYRKLVIQGRMKTSMPETPAVLSSTRSAVELIEWMMGDAEFMAELIVEYLERLGVLPPLEKRGQPVELPAEFLKDLAAVLRLALWERTGLRDEIGDHLPRAKEALASVFAKFGLTPRDARFEAVSENLFFDVQMTALRRLAWASRGELHADVALDEPEDDELLRVLAEFLWSHRAAGARKE